VQATCDRVLIINEGKIVADGTPEQLQQEFRGAESVTVELRTGAANPVEQVSPKLRSLPSVTGVEMLSRTGPAGRFRLHVEKGADIRETVFHLAVAEKWILLELTTKKTSLEEVFHKLTMS